MTAIVLQYIPRPTLHTLHRGYYTSYYGQQLMDWLLTTSSHIMPSLGHPQPGYSPIIMPPVLSMEQLSGEDLKALRQLYWTPQNETENKWKCSQCPTIRVMGNAWTNLDTNAFEKHTSFHEVT